MFDLPTCFRPVFPVVPAHSKIFIDWLALGDKIALDIKQNSTVSTQSSATMRPAIVSRSIHLIIYFSIIKFPFTVSPSMCSPELVKVTACWSFFWLSLFLRKIIPSEIINCRHCWFLSSQVVTAASLEQGEGVEVVLQLLSGEIPLPLVLHFQVNVHLFCIFR